MIRVLYRLEKQAGNLASALAFPAAEAVIRERLEQVHGRYVVFLDIPGEDEQHPEAIATAPCPYPS